MNKNTLRLKATDALVALLVTAAFLSVAMIVAAITEKILGWGFIEVAFVLILTALAWVLYVLACDV